MTRRNELEIILVGNEAARDLLWAEAVRVFRERKARVVVVESKDEREIGLFCDWVEEKIAEVSVFDIVSLTNKQGEPEREFAATLGRTMGATGLTGDHLATHLDRVVPHWMETDYRLDILPL